MALRTLLRSSLLRNIAASTPRSSDRFLRQLSPAPRCWASSRASPDPTSRPGSENGAAGATDKIAVNKEEKDADQADPSGGAIGGFMRGLIGGREVASQDVYVAEAKAQGVEIPPESPQRRSDLVALKRKKRVEDDEEETMRDRIFSRFSGSAFMRGAFDAKERISERIDESDNPVVNFFRNAYDNVFAENEMGMVIREIREEDKQFTVSDFLSEVEEDHVPNILGAYLAGDREKLKTMCTEGAYAMLNASIREREVANLTMDTNILAINDIELSAGKLLEDAPVLIVFFNAQQINCLRDRAGEVVEGAEDDIRAVYYAMAFVREVEYEDDVPTGGGMGSSSGENASSKSGSSDEGSKEEDKEEGMDEEKKGDGLPPWKMMEMVIRGAHSTI